jgi:hypothetical protein
LGSILVDEELEDIEFFPDRNAIVTATEEGTVRIWRAALAEDCP